MTYEHESSINNTLMCQILTLQKWLFSCQHRLCLSCLICETQHWQSHHKYLVFNIHITYLQKIVSLYQFRKYLNTHAKSQGPIDPSTTKNVTSPTDLHLVCMSCSCSSLVKLLLELHHACRLDKAKVLELDYQWFLKYLLEWRHVQISLKM
jgi:hypothetical protein